VSVSERSVHRCAAALAPIHISLAKHRLPLIVWRGKFIGFRQPVLHSFPFIHNRLLFCERPLGRRQYQNQAFSFKAAAEPATYGRFVVFSDDYGDLGNGSTGIIPPRPGELRPNHGTFEVSGA